MRVFRPVIAAGALTLAALGLAVAGPTPATAAPPQPPPGKIIDTRWGTDGYQDLQGSMAAITLSTGAREVWTRTDPYGQKITGRGVGIALVDSGIAPVTGLADPTRVVNGPDLSFESQSPNLRYLDTYGHGTHMAGIIAGRDPNLSDDQLPTTMSFAGMAPGARLVNMKVAAADGAVDVSQVVAAIDWAVAHRKDPNLNIRVLNLSFGTESLQDERLDPLSHAVESAWRNGIVVVVAAGNDGSAATRLIMPAMNPYVLAVGAADP